MMKKCVCVCVCALSALCPPAQAQLELQGIGSFTSPTLVTNAGDGSDRIFVVERRGRVVAMDAGGAPGSTEFLNIIGLVSSATLEEGLLGLAFHPEFASNGRFYVNYIGPGLTTNVVEYTVFADDPSRADPGSARVVMRYARPTINHFGGWLGFGPDGYLYITSGDGGPQNDPNDRAGDLTQRFGKVHRVDVDGGDDFPGDADHNYVIPSSNPFVGVAGAVESIWAYGLRNPWRACFDPATGDLWIADVGQNMYEEVNFQPAGDPGGRHYGWRCREGMHDTGMSCGSSPGFTDPVHEYSHSVGGCSVTGGYVYRGCALGEDYRGLYFFSDWCAGSIRTLDKDNGFAPGLAISSSLNVNSFGEDEQGELYVVTFGGPVFKIINPSNADGCDPACPADLTGDGELNFFDVSAFLSGFSAQDPIADFTGDGEFNFFDVSAFLSAFSAGCP